MLMSSNKSQHMSDELYSYILSVSLQENDILRSLREETAQIPNASWLIPPEQGQFMALLVRLLGAKKTLEIGVFTGYSALWVAQALPPEGRIVACDISEDFTSVARRYWARAGVAHKVDLRLGQAIQTLDTLLDNGEAGTFDFAFIDADKANIIAYYERSLKLVRSGGLIAIDNVIFFGRALDPTQTDIDSMGVKALNKRLYRDQRVHISLVPIGDGVMLALKK